jgi:hypothetical protein
VLDVSHNPIMLGLKPRLGTRQTLMTTGSARLLADRSGKLCKPFPVALRCMPSDSAGDDSRFLLITHYSRVNLAKIHRDNVIAGRIFRLFAILNNGTGHSALHIESKEARLGLEWSVME